MLYELCYFMAIGGSFLMTVTSIVYYLNRPLFNRVVSKVTWHGLYAYHNILTFNLYDQKDELDDISSNNSILSYTLCDGKTTTTTYIPPLHDILFVKRKISDKTYCKRINNETETISELQIIPVNKYFIQVELKQGDISVDIHENLHYFYVKNNHILDNSFLKWYLKYWYAMDLAEEYTIHIIDNDVNMVTLRPSQSVVFDDDKYIIVTNEIVNDD